MAGEQPGAERNFYRCNAASILDVPLTETSPGVYETWWTVPADLEPTIYDVVGCLVINNTVRAVQPPAVLIVLAPPAPAAPPPPGPPPAPAAPPPPGPPPAPAGAGQPAPAPVYLVPPPPAAIITPEPGRAAGGPIASGAAMRVTPDDSLILGVRSAGALGAGYAPLTPAVVLYARLWGDDGSFAGSAMTVVPPADLTVNYYAMPLGYGYLASVAAYATDARVHVGDMHVSIHLARGQPSSFVTYALLGQDYITSRQAVTWPGGRIRAAREGPGRLRYLLGTLGSFSRNTFVTVPSFAWWRVHMLFTHVSTSATAGTRGVVLGIDDPNHSMVGSFDTGLALGPSSSVDLTWGRGAEVAEAVAAGTASVPMPAVALEGLFNNSIVQANFVNAQVNDTFTQFQALVEELIED